MWWSDAVAMLQVWFGDPVIMFPVVLLVGGLLVLVMGTMEGGAK